MPALFDSDISGFGDADLVGGAHVIFVAIHLSSIGPGVRVVDLAALDHFLRAGWLSLGDRFSVGVGEVHDWWRQPIWIDFEDTLWTPDPSQDPANANLTTFATRVRWGLGSGTEGHLLVFGV